MAIKWKEPKNRDNSGGGKRGLASADHMKASGGDKGSQGSAKHKMPHRYGSKGK